MRKSKIGDIYRNVHHYIVQEGEMVIFRRKFVSLVLGSL